MDKENNNRLTDTENILTVARLEVGAWGRDKKGDRLKKNKLVVTE